MKNHCIICGKEVSVGNTRCQSCAAKNRLKNPKNHGMYIDGRSIKPNFCIDCGKQISCKAKRCSSCAHRGKLSSTYIDGRTNKKYYCKKCGTRINYKTWFSGSQLCNSCVMVGRFVGKKSSNYIDGRRKKKYKCLYCDNLIKYNAYFYGNKTCTRCSKLGERNSTYIDGRSIKPNFCLDCNRPIAWQAKRCPKCAGIFGARKGKDSPMFGKAPPHGKGSYYKNIWMRSSYEIKYAKYLDSRNIIWQYEPKAFDLGDTTYRPDFFLSQTNEFIEIKGYWRDDAKYKYELFKSLYSNIKIKLLMKKDLQKLGVLKCELLKKE